MFKKSERINTTVNTCLSMVHSIFGSKSSKILRALLFKSSETWRTRELATEAQVSLGLVSKVTNDLIDMGFLVRDRSLRLKLRKKEELLRRLASFYNLNRLLHKPYYARGTLYEIGARLAQYAKKSGLKYAFTGSFATDLLTRYIRSAEIHVFVTDESAVEKIAEDLALEVAEIGGNIIFLIPEDDSVFYGSREITDDRVGKVTIVSDVQLVLDLYNYSDRTKEAAERLLAREFAESEQDIANLVAEYFRREGLISENLQTSGANLKPDLVFYDPKTQTRVVVEIKANARLDGVEQLKNLVSLLGDKNTRGILIAKSITDTALKELRKANLEFKPLEAIEHAVHERAS